MLHSLFISLLCVQVLDAARAAAVAPAGAAEDNPLFENLERSLPMIGIEMEYQDKDKAYETKPFVFQHNGGDCGWRYGKPMTDPVGSTGTFGIQMEGEDHCLLEAQTQAMSIFDDDSMPVVDKVKELFCRIVGLLRVHAVVKGAKVDVATALAAPRTKHTNEAGPGTPKEWCTGSRFIWRKAADVQNAMASEILPKLGLQLNLGMPVYLWNVEHYDCETGAMINEHIQLNRNGKPLRYVSKNKRVCNAIKNDASLANPPGIRGMVGLFAEICMTRKEQIAAKSAGKPDGAIKNLYNIYPKIAFDPDSALFTQTAAAYNRILGPILNEDLCLNNIKRVDMEDGRGVRPVIMTRGRNDANPFVFKNKIYVLGEFRVTADNLIYELPKNVEDLKTFQTIGGPFTATSNPSWHKGILKFIGNAILVQGLKPTHDRTLKQIYSTSLGLTFGGADDDTPAAPRGAVPVRENVEVSTYLANPKPIASVLAFALLTVSILACGSRMFKKKTAEQYNLLPAV